MFAFLFLPHTKHEILIFPNSLHGWRNLISENRHDIVSFHFDSWTSLLKSKMLEFWKVLLQVMGCTQKWLGSEVGTECYISVGRDQKTLRRSERHRHANIHFSAAALPPFSFAQTWWCFLLLINMKTHKTFDGVENHRRCFLCLKWAREAGGGKNGESSPREMKAEI